MLLSWRSLISEGNLEAPIRTNAPTPGPVCRMLPLLACALSTMAWAASASPLPTLTHADQVRRLTADQAALGYPVRIRGVITDDVPAPDFFVQDSTAGVFVEGSHAPLFPHLLGNLVEVEGVTGPGRFAPVIRERSVRVLGKGTFPSAHLYSFSELADGQRDSQWVQVRGMVRSVSIDRASWHETTLAMNVASGGGQFEVRVPITHEQDVSSWIGSEVRIEGVCGSLFNAERQLVGVLFYVPRLSFIKIEAPAEEVPFSALLQFSPSQGAKRKVRVQGVVTYQQPGNALFVQNRGKGLRVLTQQDTHLEIGDVVDVTGFPALGESAPVLENAVFHRTGHEAAPEPLKFDVDAAWERYDGALVSADGRLLQRQLQPDGLNLLLQQGGMVFGVTLQGGSSTGNLLSIPLNSELRIAGICLVRSGGLWHVPESFRLLLRSPKDVVVLRAPSWWNLPRTLWLLGITAGVLLVMTIWVVVLGRRGREQMAIIRQKLRSGAVLEERNRIARELHDTLEQELTGITMQLDLAVDCFSQSPRITRQAIEMARKMSRHSMLSARRSVWDLRCHLLENGDLVSALTRAVEPLVVGDYVKLEIKVTGQPKRLPGMIEMNLLRIGQEAVANAVKHACARHLSVDLEYHPEKVRLCVSDDGRGFSPDEATLAGNGHFGLVDMRERAQSLGCHLQIASHHGGTRIEVVVPAEPTRPLHEEPKVDTYSGG